NNFNNLPPVTKNKSSSKNAFSHIISNNVGNTLNNSIHIFGFWTDEIEEDITHLHYNNLSFTLTKVNTIEIVLNITSISFEQAKIINFNLFKDLSDKMDDDYEQNKVIIAGVNTSKSIVQ
ncbi:20194_t:CDS:2, partial [Funneliformis geosporum]